MSDNYKLSGVVDFKFLTKDVDQVPIAPSSAFDSSDIRIYKGNSATQRTSASGITVTSPFDGLVGLHHVKIDLADNTDAGFYVGVENYQVVLETSKTVDGVAIARRVLKEFSIENRVADIVKILGSATTAEQLKALLAGMTLGEVVADGGNGVSTFKTNLTNANNDFFERSTITFYSGTETGETKHIAASGGYVGATKVINLASGEAFKTAPIAGDKFFIYGRIK